MERYKPCIWSFRCPLKARSRVADAVTGRGEEKVRVADWLGMEYEIVEMAVPEMERQAVLMHRSRQCNVIDCVGARMETVMATEPSNTYGWFNTSILL